MKVDHKQSVSGCCSSRWPQLARGLVLKIFFAAFTSLAASAYCADVDQLDPCVLLNAGGTNIFSLLYPPAVTTVDWNNDGKKDLVLVGFRTSWTNSAGNIVREGRVHLYLNQGTDQSPVFTTYSVIESGGTQIETWEGS